MGILHRKKHSWVYALGMGVVLAAPLSSFAEYATPVFNPHEQSVKSFGAAGAYVSFADDSSAFTLNSAGISRNLEERSLGASYRIFKKRRDFGFRAFVIDGKTENPLGWGFLFDWARTREDWHQDYRLGLSFNYKNILMIGSSSVFSRYSPTSVTTRDYWQYANDFGALAFIGNYIAVGVSAKNIIRTKGETSPYRLLAGVSGNFRQARLSLEGERNLTDEIWIARAGAELKPFQTVTVRGGGYFGRYKDASTERGYTLGLSLHPLNKFMMDFAYHDRIKSDERSFMVGLSFRI